MPYTLNLEEVEGRWIAHVADLPGAFASAATQAAAIAQAPRAIVDYLAWSDLDGHGGPPAAEPLQPVCEVREVIRAWEYAPDYEVNAFFATDRPPLTEDDAATARRLLYLTRAELLDAHLGVAPADLDHRFPGEERSINDLLRHVATGENWYLDRLGLAHEAVWEMADTLGRLFLARQQLLDALPHLVGDERVEMANGELWSPRKIVRRALWHEREHAAQVSALRARLKQEARHV